MLALTDRRVLQLRIHHLDARLERILPLLHVVKERHNLAVHRQPVLDAFLDDRQDPVDRRDVVRLLRLIALDLLQDHRRILDLIVSFERLLQLADATFHRLAHLLSLLAGIAEDDDPSVLAQLPSQGFRVLL